MKLVCNCCIFICFITGVFAQSDTPARRILLPNGWSLTPLGNAIPLGDLPLNVIVSPHKKYIAVTDNGRVLNPSNL